MLFTPMVLFTVSEAFLILGVLIRIRDLIVSSNLFSETPCRFLNISAAERYSLYPVIPLSLRNASAKDLAPSELTPEPPASPGDSKTFCPNCSDSAYRSSSGLSIPSVLISSAARKVLSSLSLSNSLPAKRMESPYLTIPSPPDENPASIDIKCLKASGSPGHAAGAPSAPAPASGEDSPVTVL